MKKNHQIENYINTATFFLRKGGRGRKEECENAIAEATVARLASARLSIPIGDDLISAWVDITAQVVL